MSLELITDRLIDGQMAAYFAPTYKDAYNWWNELKYYVHEITQSKDEQVKQLKTVTGGVLDVWSIEDPNSGRGRKYHRVIIDECEKAPKFKEAWERAIRPTLSDYQGDAWFLSTPRFGKSFFKELAQNSTKFPDWTSWTFTTYDNPHIKPEEVDAARAQLDDLTFRCEYLAEDVDITGKPFAYAFSVAKHVGNTAYDQSKFLMVSFDFNVDPITCIAAQDQEGHIKVLREFRLSNSDIYKLCDEVKAAFPNAVYSVTGDATGQNRSAITEGNINYYTVIQDKLWLSDNQIEVPTINPAVSDSRVLTNAILQNKPLTIDSSCTYLIEDLKYVEVDDTGGIDKKKDKHRSHLLDGFRYLLSTWYNDFIRI